MRSIPRSVSVVGVGTVLEQEDEVVLVQADEEEQHGAGEHAEGVEGGVAPVAAAELGHHGHHRHVEEHAHGARQQPRGGGALGPQHQPRHQAHEGEHRGHAVVEDRDLDMSPQSCLLLLKLLNEGTISGFIFPNFWI